MKYNSKYDRYVDDDLVIYRYDMNNDKLVQCKPYNIKGYINIKTKLGLKTAHRIIWETFVGEIPEGYEIDHINTNKTDNRLENLQIVTHKENMNNPLTRKHTSDCMKGKIKSSFGTKFFEHYGITKYQNVKLYNREQMWYTRHNNTCRWE